MGRNAPRKKVRDVGTIPVLEEGRVAGMIRINEVFLAIAEAVITAPKGG